MTLDKIIYDIRERLKITTDDMDMTDEYFAQLIHNKRSVLVKQRYGKVSKNIPDQLKQTVSLDLEFNNDEYGCELIGLISTNKVPDYIETYNRENVLNIMVPNLTSAPIDIISPERIPFIGNNEWLRNQIYGTLIDNRVLLFSDNAGFKLLTSVKIKAVYANPEEIFELNNSGECEFFQSEYPVNSPMVTDIVNMIVKELAPSLNIPEDKINNADESPR